MFIKCALVSIYYVNIVYAQGKNVVFYAVAFCFSLTSFRVLFSCMSLCKMNYLVYSLNVI